MRGVYGSRAGLGQVLGLLEASEENDKRGRCRNGELLRMREQIYSQEISPQPGQGGLVRGMQLQDRTEDSWSQAKKTSGHTEAAFRARSCQWLGGASHYGFSGSRLHRNLNADLPGWVHQGSCAWP